MTGIRAVGGLITIAWPQAQCLRRKLRWLLPLLTWIGVVPDLTGRLRLVPDLAGQIGSHRLDLDRLGVYRPGQQWFAGPGTLARSACRFRAARAGSLARRDHGSDGPPDPERVKPLLGLGIAGLGRGVPPPLTRLRVPAVIWAILTGFTLPRLAPALTPPGHD